MQERGKRMDGNILVVLLVVVAILCAVTVALLVVSLVRKPKSIDFSESERRILGEIQGYITQEMSGLRQEMSATTLAAINSAAQTQADTQRQLSERQDARLKELREQLIASQENLQRNVNLQMSGLDERFAKFAMQSDQRAQAMSETQAGTQRQLSERQDARLKELREQLIASQENLQRNVNSQMAGLDERFAKFAMQNDQRAQDMRKTLEERVAAMQAGNEKKLEEMRHTVDEKLQKTLNERLKQSFGIVSESLDKVQRGLGEMQTLAGSVGDLKKVLTNVKTKGILGEIQLGAILEEILSPEQYETNVETIKGSGRRVEYAVKLPGEGQDSFVWLPIDAKFPSEAYANLLDAQQDANKEAEQAAGKALEARVRQFAKDIREKYVQVPQTTEFAIMFLPMEGLYAEVVRRGMVERLQNEFKINISGPTTMAAFLNSLQMGFRTLAIQKRSSEVWQVLGEVKSEFEKFSDYLQKTKLHIEQAGKDIDHLIGTRSNVMQRKLRSVTSLPSGQEVPEVPSIGQKHVEEE